jgi:hypothetical protein
VSSNEPRPVTRHDIEDFLLERATIADIEAIFGCLGNAFGEAIRGQRS